MKPAMRCLAICSVLLLLMLSATAAEAEPLETEHLIPGSMGNVYGILKMPAARTPVPLVILSHGFGGNHTGSLDYADRFVSGGFAAFSLDFCGGGFGSRSDGTMPDMSVLTEAEDLNAVIDYFMDDPRFSSFCLWGESQGGFVSSYVAAERPEDIAALVIEYPAYVLQDDAKRRQLPDGSFPERSTLLGMAIGRVYSEDVVSFDIYEQMSAYDGPVLILHGDSDWLVPISYSERAVKVFPNAELIVMPGQGHGFRGSSRREAMETELIFLQTNQTDGRTSQ